MDISSTGVFLVLFRTGEAAASPVLNSFWSIHPGITAAGAYRVSACSETNVASWLMGTRMAAAAVIRRCRRAGAEAAKHESQNENSGACITACGIRL